MALYADTTSLLSYPVTAYTPTANTLQVAFIAVTGAGGFVDPAFGESHLKWSKKASCAIGTGNLWIYTANVDASPGSIAVAADFTGSANTPNGCLVSIIQIAGHDTANPVRQTASNPDQSAANPSLTFGSALLTANAYLIGYKVNQNAPGATAPSGWTKVADGGYLNPTAGMVSAYRATGETGTVYTFTEGAAAWSTIGIEINADPGIAAYPRRRIIG